MYDLQNISHLFLFFIILFLLHLLEDGDPVCHIPFMKLLLPFFLITLLVISFIILLLILFISRPSARLADYVMNLFPCLISGFLSSILIHNEPSSLQLLSFQESHPSQSAFSLLRPFENTGSYHAFLIYLSHLTY